MNDKIYRLYRLILKCGWKVESCRRIQEDYWYDKGITVLEIELVSPNEMVDDYILLGPKGMPHG